MTENPKLEDSRIVDCIPQTGKCPIGCTDCFYNGPGWYRTRDTPLIPTFQETIGNVVRVNSGNDSNVDRKLVIEVARRYNDYFFNTSVPNFDFPGPVVFTVNGRGDNQSYLANRKDCKGLMFVRFRLNPWNLEAADKVVAHYTKYNVPVVMTFMRYSERRNIPRHHWQSYAWTKHIVTEYFMIKNELRDEIMARWKDNPLVKECGSTKSEYCKDCGNCYNLYFRWRKRKCP